MNIRERHGQETGAQVDRVDFRLPITHTSVLGHLDIGLIHGDVPLGQRDVPADQVGEALPFEAELDAPLIPDQTLEGIPVPGALLQIRVGGLAQSRLAVEGIPGTDEGEGFAR